MVGSGINSRVRNPTGGNSIARILTGRLRRGRRGEEESGTATCEIREEDKKGRDDW